MTSPCERSTAPFAPYVVAIIPVQAARESPYHAASVSLTTTRSALCNTDTSISFAGARFAQKNPVKFSAACAIVLPGISSWQISASAFGSSNDSGSSRLFAPGATTIWFSPDGATEISATPVGASASIMQRSRSTPPSRSSTSASSAVASSPTHAISLTFAPSRCAASAWFAPLPPGKRLNLAPVTVSPAAGSRDTEADRSRFTEPMTTISVIVQSPNLASLPVSSSKNASGSTS